MIEAKVIADSIARNNRRIITLQVKFHRFVLPEFNTHRVFSRNFSSSRAIPTKKLLEQVRTDPAMPVHWGKNQPGMQAVEELSVEQKQEAMDTWIASAYRAASLAEKMAEIGTHKQIVNRIIEPYLWANGIVTSTEWDNWFELRAHEDAQPEIHALAIAMKDAIDKSTPTVIRGNEWHLPYIREDEKTAHDNDTLLKISAARCCRVSYLKHDGSDPNIEEDLTLFERLAGSRPLHASPLEHQATPDPHFECKQLNGNFNGWIQYRKIWENKIYNTKQ